MISWILEASSQKSLIVTSGLITTRKHRIGLSLASYAFGAKSWTLSEKPGTIGGPIGEAILITHLTEQVASKSGTSPEKGDTRTASDKVLEVEVRSRRAGARRSSGRAKSYEVASDPARGSEYPERARVPVLSLSGGTGAKTSIFRHFRCKKDW